MLAVHSEGTHGPPGEPEMPSATALGGHEAAAAACLRQAPANFERGIRAFKIHVFPLEGQELALPQARGDSQYVEGLHSVPLDRIEERPYLIPRERGCISSLRGCGGFTDAAALRGIRPSSVACLSALLSVRWMCNTLRGASPESSFSR